MSQNRLYKELAYLWPLVSSPEDYREGAACWREALRSRLGPGMHNVLELGVGGGHHLSHLTADFRATAVDLSAQMLEHSRKLNPDVEHHVGDMRSIRLGRKYNAVLIHDAIAYMLTQEDLLKTFPTAAAHLEPGGVFITAPDFFRETFQGPRIDHSTHSDDTVELTFIDYTYDPDPNDTTAETIMFYLIKNKEGLRIEQDRHVFGLFPRNTWTRLMTAAGFTVEEWPCLLESHPSPYILLVGILLAS